MMTTNGLNFLSPGNAWQSIYESLESPKVYVSQQWLVAASKIEHGSRPELAVFQQDKDIIAFPYLVRPIPNHENLFDLTSAYEFGGFWFSKMSLERQQKLMIQFDHQFCSEAKLKKYISGFIRLSPWLTKLELGTAQNFTAIQHQEHVWVDASKPYEQINKEYKPRVRRQLRQASEAQLWVDQTTKLQDFLDLYYDNLKQLEASSYYYFPKEFFEAGSGDLHFFTIKTPSGEICGIHSYLISPPIIYAFLCHADKNHSLLRPNNFGFDHMIQYASKRPDIEVVHLGGGSESLVAFKEALSPKKISAYHLKLIFDHDVYQQLSTTENSVNNDYFPLYRA